jgi:catechol 2,3-dioxygenase-like lactoylglutathione lyase family enzyme
MAVRLLSVTFEARDPERLARFWAALLGREAGRDADRWVVPGAGSQLSLSFTASTRGRGAPNRMHLHLTSTSLDDQHETVATALRLGADHLDVGQRPEEGHIVLADPEGNELCVLEPGNAFLARCGLLGELSCDGTRRAGVFWSQALDWPLVWDQDEETAVQSPAGGTKLSWGGPPVAAHTATRRQLFELAPVDGDPSAAVRELRRLGASDLEAEADRGAAGTVITMADPDGNEFRIHAA